MAKVQLGTVSEGTLRTEDLLTAFAWELAYILGDEATAQEKALISSADFKGLDFEVEKIAEEAVWVVDDLVAALQEHAPPFVCFGTLEGDGAHFGWWPDRDAIDRAIDEGEVIEFPHSLSNETVTVNHEEGVQIHVNDHGNVTITSLDSGDVLLELV